MPNSQFWIQMLPLILIVPIMYFVLIRPQKKKDQETTRMRNNVKVGDEIVTIGGIVGKVVRTKDDALIIQVGADKVKFEIMRWAVSRVTAEAKGTKGGYSEEEEAPKKMPKRMKKAEAAPAEDAQTENTSAENTEDSDK